MEQAKLLTPEMLQSMSRVTFDIECLHDVDRKHFNFDDSEFLGIAIACTINHEGAIRDFTQDEAFRLYGHLLKHQLVVGYNLINFDFPIVGGCLMTPQNPFAKKLLHSQLQGRVVDLCKDFEEALGHRISLENVTIPTLGLEKEMKGAFAPEKWRAGQKFEVIEYCRGDIKKTDALLIKAVNGEELKFLNKAGEVKTFKCQVKLR